MATDRATDMAEKLRASQEQTQLARAEEQKSGEELRKQVRGPGLYGVHVILWKYRLLTSSPCFVCFNVSAKNFPCTCHAYEDFRAKGKPIAK